MNKPVATLEEQNMRWAPETASRLEELLNSKRLFRKNPDHYSVTIEPSRLESLKTNYLKIALERDNGEIEYTLNKSIDGSSKTASAYWANVGSFGEGLYSDKTVLFDLFEQFDKQARESDRYDQIIFTRNGGISSDGGMYGCFYVVPMKMASIDDEVASVSGFVKDLSAKMKVLDRGITLDEAKSAFVRDVRVNLTHLGVYTIALASTIVNGLSAIENLRYNPDSPTVESFVIGGTILAGASLLSLFPLGLRTVYNKVKRFTENPLSYTFQKYGCIVVPDPAPKAPKINLV